MNRKRYLKKMLADKMKQGFMRLYRVMKIQRLFLCLLLTGCSMAVCAQGYRMEIGAAGGVASYIGDANTTFLANPRPAGSALYRYNLNRRFALKADLGLAQIAGSTAGRSTSYPNGVEMSFRRWLVDGSLQMEFNFYEFGAPDYLPGSSHWSPYVAAGLGLTGYESDKVRVSGSLPLGIGLKYKLPCRLNIGLEVSHRFSFTDRLDYSGQGGDWQLDDPWIARSDWNKNKDGYTTVKIFITYDFFFIGSSCYKE